MSQHQNKELERAVLGAVILEASECLHRVIGILPTPDVFYYPENKTVYAAIKSLFEAGTPVDIMTVSAELKRSGAVTLDENPAGYFVSKLTERIASAANVEAYALTVMQLFLNRELAKLGLLLENRANEAAADPFELIGEFQSRLQTITMGLASTAHSVADIHREKLAQIKSVLAGNNATGILSGIKRLDAHTGGWQPGTLNIISARPGMGKTAFALQLAKQPAIASGTPTAIFSLEMSKSSLTGRMVASEACLNVSKVNQNRLDAGELLTFENGCQDLLKAPIYIDDTPALSITQIKARSRKLYYDKGVRLFIIDYLQLVNGEVKKNGNREQEISNISRGLKALAKELNVPVIALSQLSREVEKRPSKRPQLSDLRESGSIEQDADIVAFLFRPAYYNQLDGYQFGDHILDPQNLLIVDIAKGRDLEPGEIPARFFGAQMVVSDYNL